MEPNTTPGTSPELNATPAPAEPAKKSKGLLFATIIFAILAITGIGASVYFFMDSNNKATEISTLEDQLKSKNEIIATLNSGAESDENVSDQSENITNTYYSNLLSNIKNSNQYYTYLKRETFDEWGRTFRVEIDHSANLVVYEGSESYILANDIVDFFHIFVGNGGGGNLYFIDGTGNVSVIREFDQVDLDNPQIELLESLKNVVSIRGVNETLHYEDDGAHGSGVIPIYIDIEGNFVKN